MQKYTLTVLIKEKLTEADRNNLFESFKKSFSNLIREDLWGVRSLAYSIKHNNKAFFAHFEFEAEPKAIITLDKNIRLNEDIIRHLIVRVESKRQKTKITKEKIAEEKVEEIKKEEPVIEEKGKARNK